MTNQRALLAAAIVLGIVALSALFWAPPLITQNAQATSTPIVPTATPAPPAVHNVRVTVRDAETGDVIVDAQVSVGSESGRTGRIGLYHAAVPHDTQAKVQVTAPGYLDWAGKLDTTQATQRTVLLPVDLTPNSVRGQVIGHQRQPLARATVTFADRPIPVDRDGQFELRRVATGDAVHVSHPGYVAAVGQYDGRSDLHFALESIDATISVRDAMTGLPLPDVTVCQGEHCQEMDREGKGTFVAAVPNGELTAQRSGYHPATLRFIEGQLLSFELAPAELYGYVRDAETGAPITRTIVLSGEQIIPLDENGMYHLDLDQIESVFVKSPGYKRVTVDLGPDTRVDDSVHLVSCADSERYPCADIMLPRFSVRGIYASYNLLMWDRPRMLELIDMVDRSPILNAIVVDIKGDFGYLAFESDDPLIASVDAMATPRLPVPEFLAICKEKGIYTIARMVIFKDSPLAAAYPELAVRHPDGEVFYDREGMAWIDPTREESWDYSIAVTKEAIRLGFDEVQYDYLRFPSDSTSLEIVRALVYSVPSTIESRTDAIEGFVTAAKKAVDPTHAFLSADLFGYALVIAPEHDMRIGQRLIDLAPHVDYVCPMIYPSTFQSGNLGLASPSDEPYKVIEKSMALAKERTNTPVRPWLQHYWYERADIAAQREAAEAATDVGWCFWNARGEYDYEFFVPERDTP